MDAQIRLNGARMDHKSLKAEAQAETKDHVSWAHLRLPPFPNVAIRVLQLANNEDASLHQLSELISSDAAFASEVLTIANSAVYAPRFPTRSILQAIAVMGANHLQGMCLTVGVRAYLGKSLNNPLIRIVWRHNLACGMIAHQLAAAGFMDKDTAYTAGVLHDIGRLALVVIRPDQYAELLKKHQGSGATILQLEAELFGSDHCQAGLQLVSAWNLPHEFETIVSEHHAPRRTDGGWNMAELIKMSCKLADAAGFPAFTGCELTSFSELSEELPPRERRAFPSDLDTLAGDIAAKIQAVESL
jgi:putative nucleotidyltransferase with HDIG domain